MLVAETKEDYSLGLEARCTATLNGANSEGKAHCGNGTLEFRGGFRICWKWNEIRVTVRGGDVELKRGSDVAVLHLGPAAEKWAKAIQNPKSRMDKLGVKPQQRWAVWGIQEPGLGEELENRTGQPKSGGADLDWAFVFLDSQSCMPVLLEARAKIAAQGGIWAIWAKGRKELTENHIRDFALSHGLVDVKVASFSTTLSALKLVIPVALRAPN